MVKVFSIQVKTDPSTSLRWLFYSFFEGAGSAFFHSETALFSEVVGEKEL
jgi:hypothetical protein